jgi:hypothetical protein
MKIRILGNSLRLRLTQSEVQNLLSEGKVKERISFGPSSAQQLNYIFKKAATTEIAASFNGNIISILVPNDIADQWANSTQISLEAQLPIGNGAQLKILIEKDFKCLTDRAGEDESDMFPNPEVGEKC